MAEIHVSGLAALQKFLDELPVKIEKNILRSALRKGAVVIMAEAKQRCPVGLPTNEAAKKYGGYPGALRDSIRVGTNYRAGRVTASVKAGGKTKKQGDAYYAHMVEFGTRAHVIKTVTRKGSLVIGGRFVGRSVQHPGARPRPFMRPSLDGKAQEAVIAVGEQMKVRLTKEGIDTADIVIEGDE